MDNTTQKLSLNLSIEEINLILSALGKEPYANVFQLVQNIQQQANIQLTEPATTSPGSAGALQATEKP